MSVDTRTPRPGFEEQPPLSMVKVDCDPAQVIVNHASFRVKLASSQRPSPARATADTARIPAMSGGGGAARRRAPVVWSGRSAPGDLGATGLLQAVRNSSVRGTGAALAEAPGGPYDTGATGNTQVIPRIDLGDDTMPTPRVPHRGGGAGSDTPLLPPMRQAVGAYDTPEYDPYGGGGARHRGGHDDRDDREYERDFERDLDRGRDHDGRHDMSPSEAAVRHAYYPGRRMNLGVVLLPLRVFLGLISIYAGMGKLCDPVYFDGGKRGSMVAWLSSLQPWALAEPLRDFALSHPVGAGLSVAFLQVVAGVLTVLGLWQRLAACCGTLLSAALILTVSWRTVPVYDAPDIIYLAAWSPLIIAGAPVYSVDGRLAGEAWRKLGPRTPLRELRRRVLRRGAVVATVVIGLTLLIGSMLGGAVRSTEMVTVPGPNNPVNQLPGSPLPQKSGKSSASGSPTGEARQNGGSAEPTAGQTSGPAAEQSKPGETPARRPGGVSTGGQPSQTQGTGQAPPQTQEQAPPPSSSQGPATSGGSTGGAGQGGGTTGGGDGGGTTGGGGGSSTGGGGGGARNPIGGLLG
ncbi:DoxX family protein [Streptomyces niveus]|uniref:DoxX family protein n=1 Tax=Streptomyces TaxID=1883 RepID=UPI001072AB55|nr:DoxX family protein [Streptomyces sp. 4R-3d]TFI28121.1 DoxX family protein [Streptomyces sp. 4R-3d]